MFQWCKILSFGQLFLCDSIQSCLYGLRRVFACIHLFVGYHINCIFTKYCFLYKQKDRIVAAVVLIRNI